MELCCNYKLIYLLFTPTTVKKKEHKEKGSIYQENRTTQYRTELRFNLVFLL